MQCSKCQRDAIVFQSYSGLHLCGQHIIADVEAKAKKMIRVQGWLKPDDHIAVILSDNPRSNALLFFLKQLTEQRRDIRISAIVLTGADGARSDTSHAKRIAERLNTTLLEISLPDESEIRTGTSAEKTQDKSLLPLPHPCHSLLINKTAHQHGITKIAWGLCVDDVAGVVLGYILQGDGEKLVRRGTDQSTPPRVCPFITVTAAEISLYATLSGVGEEPALIPDPGDRLNKDMVVLLDAYTNNHPATKYALLNLGENLAGSPAGIADLIHACEGYMVSQRECCNNISQFSEVKYGTT